MPVDTTPTASAHVRHRRTVRARLGDAAGTNMLEVAFVLPLLLVMTFSIIDFACLFYVHLALENGISQATRYAITGNLLPDPDSAGQQLSREDSIKTAMRRATPTLTIPDDAFSFEYLPDGEDTWIDGTGEPGDIMKARVDYQWDIMTPLMKPFFDNGQIQLTAESAMKNESRFE